MAQVIYRVPGQCPDLIVRQRNNVPEIIAQLCQIGAHTTAIYRHSLTALSQCGNGLGDIFVDMFGRQIGTGHEDIAIGGVGAAQRKHRTDTDVIGKRG